MKKIFTCLRYVKSVFPSSLRLLLFMITVSAFLFTGCRKEIETASPLAPASETGVILDKDRAPVRANIGKVPVVTGSSETGRGKPVFIDPLRLDPQYRQMVLRALKVSEAECNDNTKLNLWLDDQLKDWSADMIFYSVYTDMINLPAYHALFFENRSFGQYFGQKGEYTLRLALSFLNLKRFWNIDSRGMVLAALHGNMLHDRYKVFSTYRDLYDLDAEDAVFYTNVVSQLLKTYPLYRNGNHPIFSFNAFSQPSFYFEPIGVLPAKIVMGDGILDGFRAIGYGDVAPQAILAHEFGHQVQFSLGIFGEDTPESTRRTELMADALSAYYLSHIRGEFMRWGRMRQFLQVFFNLGDCGTTSVSHHGTPNQRMAAAEWAYEVAKKAERQLRILKAEEFVAMFDSALPNILAH